MNNTTAPTQQLLITSETIGDKVNAIYIKKKDIQNPDVINALKHLCKIADNDPKRLMAIFLMRKEILENASDIYINGNEDKLFNESIEELDVIIKLLEENTITR